MQAEKELYPNNSFLAKTAPHVKKVADITDAAIIFHVSVVPVFFCSPVPSLPPCASGPNISLRAKPLPPCASGPNISIRAKPPLRDILIL